MIISCTFTFEASHILPNHPGKCSRLHGHSYELTVSVKGSVDPETGFVCDYGELKALVEREIIDKVDHRHLGQHHCLTSRGKIAEVPMIFPEGFYPSAENLVNRFAEILNRLRFQERKEGVPEVTLHEVILRETKNTSAIWRPNGT